MFQRTVATLKRWIGSSSDKATADERRVWVRSLPDGEPHSLSLQAPNHRRLSVQVRDLSRGGIRLLVPTPLVSGTLLSVELPGGDNVLASVVHAAVEAEGGWNVGCAFSSPLDEEDLRAFMIRPAFVPEQRQQPRIPCATRVTYRLGPAGGLNERAAQGVDISAGGIGLIVEQPVEVGTILHLELEGMGYAIDIIASVVRVTSRAADEWLLGCLFISELSPEELRALM